MKVGQTAQVTVTLPSGMGAGWRQAVQAMVSCSPVLFCERQVIVDVINDCSKGLLIRSKK